MEKIMKIKANYVTLSLVILNFIYTFFRDSRNEAKTQDLIDSSLERREKEFISEYAPIVVLMFEDDPNFNGDEWNPETFEELILPFVKSPIFSDDELFLEGDPGY
jgi:hypothetical protein